MYLAIMDPTTSVFIAVSSRMVDCISGELTPYDKHHAFRKYFLIAYVAARQRNRQPLRLGERAFVGFNSEGYFARKLQNKKNKNKNPV